MAVNEIATAARAAGVDKDANALIAFALGYKIGSKEVSDKSSDAAAAATGRKKIAVVSSEVVDSNPYSRLMALKRMGIVENYERIRDYTIIIVGIGGVGSVAAEMLTRCGIGKLILFDYDKVEIANMNRLFFTPDQAGMTKTNAAKKTLTFINPDVEIKDYCFDITTPDNYRTLLTEIKTGSKTGGPVDMVLGCVDNFGARIALNQACCEADQIWMESGVSEDAVNGHIQMIEPGRTACFECLPPLVVASDIDERTLKREGVCAASLPTTMGMVAGMLVQNTLKQLLKFGQPSYYLGYNAMSNFFPQSMMRCASNCINSHCRKLQKKYAGKWKPYVWKPARLEDDQEDDQWGFECCSDSEEDDDDGPAPAAGATAGLKFAYADPAPSPAPAPAPVAAAAATETVALEDDIDDLAEMLGDM